MKARTAIIVIVSVFFILCAGLVTESVVKHPQQAKDIFRRVVPLAGVADDEPEPKTAETTESEIPTVSNSAEPVIYPQLNAVSSGLRTFTLGALYDKIERTDDPDKYKFQIVFTNKGAAVQQVTLSEFAKRGTEETEPLVLLSQLTTTNGASVYTLANTDLRVAPAQAERFGTKAFPLDKLNWKLVENPEPDEIRFEALLKNAETGEEMLKVVKTYRIQPGSYELDCDIAVENLGETPIKIQMQMQGPGGIAREGVRQDARRVKLAYRTGEAGVEVEALNAVSMAKMIEKGDTEDFYLKSKNSSTQLWSALTNMYFAAIVRPIPVGDSGPLWLQFNRALYYPSTTEDKDDQNCSYTLMSEPIILNAAGSDGAVQTYSLATYMGPKDKQIFEHNETYKALQYYLTIDFRTCCCPVSVIAPLAFGVMWLMNTMYALMGPLGNYGVVIIILVFLVRVIMHPITKKGQVSMMRMQKLGPKMKEIQAKYANNKQEMNKQVMALYRDAGVSPVSGMLPMFIQMPIWIALWTAVYTSIDLRGAGFLPFWITDLSMPDQLFKFPAGINLPFFGQYFNLLPILMGVVMFVQQKMMPSSQSAQPDSQMAQQQKMMMIMMPLMFPLILYSGPSGVNLYILSSISAGIIEQKVIRKHLKEKEEAEAAGKVPVTSKTGGKVKKKKPKPFFKG